MQSLYIPKISVTISEEDIKRIFDTCSIGDVSRVDFLLPRVESPYTRACFVHLDFTTHCWSRESSMIYGNICRGDSYKFQLPQEWGRGYWWLLPNKNPIPETTINMHQMVENMRLLEERFVEKVARLEQEVASLKCRVKYLEDPEWMENDGELLHDLSSQMAQQRTMEDLSTDEEDALNTGFTEYEYENSYSYSGEEKDGEYNYEIAADFV